MTANKTTKPKLVIDEKISVAEAVLEREIALEKELLEKNQLMNRKIETLGAQIESKKSHRKQLKDEGEKLIAKVGDAAADQKQMDELTTRLSAITTEVLVIDELLKALEPQLGELNYQKRVGFGRRAYVAGDRHNLEVLKFRKELYQFMSKASTSFSDHVINTAFEREVDMGSVRAAMREFLPPEPKQVEQPHVVAKPYSQQDEYQPDIHKKTSQSSVVSRHRPFANADATGVATVKEFITSAPAAGAGALTSQIAEVDKIGAAEVGAAKDYIACGDGENGPALGEGLPESEEAA